MISKRYETDVLITGGGTSGVAAAIQAARQNVNVVIVEETPWLGGMLTAAGVSAIDGNHRMPSGIWGEFRQKLYDHYGGAEAVATGWVSNTLFEPSFANRIWNEWIGQYKNITLLHGYSLVQVTKEGNRVCGGIYKNQQNDEVEVIAKISIEATEYGDFMAAAGCGYRIGRESFSETGEAGAPDISDDLIQDMTYTVILKDYGQGADRTIPKPENYNPEDFRGCCKEWPRSDSDIATLSSAQTMLEYGKLPNQKYMINWPKVGNDYYANLLEMDRPERETHFQKAKAYSLCFIYFIQTQLGFKYLGIADDEFPSDDQLPFIPYIRESRRLSGKETLNLNDIIDPYAHPERPVYQAGVSVGDYPLDHHHSIRMLPEQEDLPGIPAYNIPYGALVPLEIEGLLVAEKSISVTHVINGCSRLQPVVIQLGQAAGAAAAICVQKECTPADVNVRQLQQVLLEAGCYLMPFTDLLATDWCFQAVQRIGLSGLMRGEGRPNPWANDFKFHPDAAVDLATVKKTLAVLGQKSIQTNHLKTDDAITVTEGLTLIWQALGQPAATPDPGDGKSEYPDRLPSAAFAYFSAAGYLDQLAEPDFQETMSRKQWAYLLDKIFDPFNRLPFPFIEKESQQE